MSNPELERSIEAILMVVDEPVTELTLASVLERTVDEVVEALEHLVGSYEGRGFALQAINGGWRFYSHPECSAVVEKFVLDGQQNRLTQAALETLAVIAYRQPVSRARVSAIYLLVINIVGIGLGATVASAISDHIFADETRIGDGVSLVALVSVPVAGLLFWRCQKTFRALQQV